jgi:C-terminal processing protease CtpA/Prc
MKFLKRLVPMFQVFVTVMLLTSTALAAKGALASSDAEAAYAQTWELVRDRYVDAGFNGQDWNAWQHKFDGRLNSMPEAYDAIQQMLSSLGDKYTRILRPVANGVQTGSPALVASIGAGTGAAVTSKMLSNGVAYIKISSFAPVNTAEQFAEQLKQMENATAIVIDMRGNRGGQVRNALEMADMFLNDGTIVTTVSRDGSKTFSASGTATNKQKIALLVDENSASATEIFTGAMKDNHRATVVGTHTFGKGLVQEIAFLPGGAQINMTVSHYLTPAGNDINKVGLQPDVKVADGQDAVTTAMNVLQ